MREFAIVIAAVLGFGIYSPLAEQAKTDLLPSNPDAAWKELEKALKPPPPPAEWSGKTPTPQQRAEFTKYLGEQSKIVAAKAREFYTRFPDHPKAEEAKKREEQFTRQAAAFLPDETPAAPPEEPAPEQPKIEPNLEEKINAAHRRAMQKRPEGISAVLKELEAALRELIKEYPEEPVLWQQMMIIPQYAEEKEEKLRVLTDVINSKAASEDTIARAKGWIRAIGAVGRPLEISFTAADGREIDIQKMKGKVVLVDFWASWCGPCIASFPEVIDLYNKYHEQGLEIVGINMDRNRRAMDQAIARFQIPWPHYFDGKGWGTKYALEYSVSSIPSMWLVDKAGILRTMEARADLEKQITTLLAEKL